MQWAPIFMTMLYTGMRVSEVTGLEWCDIDFDNNIIRLNHRLVYYDGKYEVHQGVGADTTKNCHRNIPLTPEVKEELMIYKDYLNQAEITSKFEVDGYSDFVFLNKDGRPYQQAPLNRALHRFVEDINLEILDASNVEEPLLLPYITCHTFRHTCATRMVEAGMAPKAVQQILGHSDIRITLDLYCSPDVSFYDTEMDKFIEHMRRTGK